MAHFSERSTEDLLANARRIADIGRILPGVPAINAEAITEGLIDDQQHYDGPKPYSEVENLGLLLQQDPDLLWAWQCNLAMMAFDAGADIKKANIRSADFLASVFGADPRKTSFWETLNIVENDDA
jgi:hypothetical protein